MFLDVVDGEFFHSLRVKKYVTQAEKNLKNYRSLDTIVEFKRLQKRVTYFYIQPLFVPAPRERITVALSTLRVPPAFCRSPLRYEQQKAGATPLSLFPENS